MRTRSVYRVSEVLNNIPIALELSWQVSIKQLAMPYGITSKKLYLPSIPLSLQVFFLSRNIFDVLNGHTVKWLVVVRLITCYTGDSNGAHGYTHI